MLLGLIEKLGFGFVAYAFYCMWHPLGWLVLGLILIWLSFAPVIGAARQPKRYRVTEVE